MDDICRNTEEYKPNRKAKILIAFDDVITDMISNKKLDPIGTGSLNVSLIFITQFYFVLPIGLLTCSTYALFYYESSKQTKTYANCI